MSHAHHFLQRLDRVPREHTDFALELYRDEDLLQWILRYAHLPEGEERVALSLVESRGPYVVVTRDGHFVTALGDGMSTGDLRVLSRGQVDTFADRVRDARRRQELAGDIAAPGKKPIDLIALLERRPHGLSREEFTAIAGWNPIMQWRFLDNIFDTAQLIEDLTKPALGGTVPGHKRDKIAQQAWLMAHAIGAWWPLATMGDLAWCEDVWSRWPGDYGPTVTATREHSLAIAMRGAWAAARMGKPLLPTYKRVLSKPSGTIVFFDAMLATTAIGLRHSRCAGDARRILEMLPAIAGEVNLAWSTSILEKALRALEQPEVAHAEAVHWGQRIFGTYSRKGLPEGAPYRGLKDEDVPEDIALTTLANHDTDSQANIAFSLLPWVARLESPEDLYFPEDLACLVRVPVTDERANERLERTKPDLIAKTKPVRSEEKPGRNDPCSCGSGAKYKKCHGR